MYNARITIDPSNPSHPLPDLSVGLLSAVKLYVDGVPSGATGVKMIYKPAANVTAFEISASKTGDDYVVTIPGGVINSVGRWTYEIVVAIAGGNYWSSRGGLSVIPAKTSGVIPSPVDPAVGRYACTHIGDNYADATGEIELEVPASAVSYDDDTTLAEKLDSMDENIGAAADTAGDANVAVNLHVAKTDNPHSVTAGQVKAVSYEQQTLTDQQKSQARANIAGASSADLTSHTGNTSNPHSVTAAQVGALPLSGGTMTGNIILPNGKGIEFFDDTASVAILEVNPDYADDGRIYLPAQTGTLALKSEIPAAVVVDQALNPSSNNPLANSAVAASLPYAQICELMTLDTEVDTWKATIRNRSFTSISRWSDTLHQQAEYIAICLDGKYPLRVGTPSQSFDAVVRFEVANTATTYPTLWFCDSDYADSLADFFLMDGSVTEFEAGKAYLILIFSRTPYGNTYGNYLVKIIEDTGVQQ